MFGIKKKERTIPTARDHLIAGGYHVAAKNVPRVVHPAGTEPIPPRTAAQSRAARQFDAATVAELGSYFADPTMLPRITKLMAKDNITDGYDLMTRLRSMKGTVNPLVDGAL